LPPPTANSDITPKVHASVQTGLASEFMPTSFAG
jgi:hypothetical protein